MEEKIRFHENTIKILEKFRSSKIVEIKNYKEVFNRASQNYSIQSKVQNLIIAEKRENFIYEGSKLCNNYEYENFFYVVSLMNCIYKCEYCFLSGMYPSPNIVVFVNLEDYVEEVKKISQSNKSVFLSLSYESDIVAFENIFDGTSYLIGEMSKIENLLCEVRTKSNSVHSLKFKGVPENVIFSWTLSPDEISGKYEKFAPNLKERIRDINFCLQRDLRVRICIDPVIYIRDYERIYKDFIEILREEIVLVDKIEDFSLGTFRIPNNYLKKIRKIYPNSELINFPFLNVGGYSQYHLEIKKKLIKTVRDELLRFLPGQKIKIYG